MIVISDFEEALKVLSEHPEFAERIETIWNVGGSDLYRLGLFHPWTHKIVLTKIEAEV